MKRAVPSIAFLIWYLASAAPHAAGQGGPAVFGVVRDTHGVPQMGALVELLSGNAVISRVFTDDHGRYELQAMQPGRYGVKASSTLLLPVTRRDLNMQAGAHVLANLTMTAIYEVGVWFPTERGQRKESSDDWRWTLRSSANRPLLRLGEDDPQDGFEGGAGANRTRVEVSTGARSGLLGESGFQQTIHLEDSHILPMRSASFGAGFAVADEGTASRGGSTAAYMSMHLGDGAGSASEMVASAASEPTVISAGSESMQVLSLASAKQMVLGNGLFVDAGGLLVSERTDTTRWSTNPYLRVVVSPLPGIAVQYRMATNTAFQDGDDAGDRIAPELLADAQGRPVVLRSLHQEIDAAHMQGKDDEVISFYRDHLPVQGVNGTGQLHAGEFVGLPIIADPASGTLRITSSGAVGQGLSVAWTHRFAESTSTTLRAGYGTALGDQGASVTWAQMQRSLRHQGALQVTGNVQTRISRTGTAFRAQYRWQPDHTLSSVDPFNADQDGYASASIRQRIWIDHRLHSLQAVAEFKNMLEQGYQAVVGPDGEIFFLAQVPRTLQAGLVFDF